MSDFGSVHKLGNTWCFAMVFRGKWTFDLSDKEAKKSKNATYATAFTLLSAFLGHQE